MGDSLTTVTMATQVYSSPSLSTSYYIDRESSGVSIAYETTSATVSCHSSNNFSLILLFEPSCQFDQIISVPSTLLLLHEALLLSLLTFRGTIRLIVQSLLSILSLVDVYSSYDAYCTSGECVVVRKWVQSPELVFP